MERNDLDRLVPRWYVLTWKVQPMYEMAFLSMLYRLPAGSYWRGPACGAAFPTASGRPGPGWRLRFA